MVSKRAELEVTSFDSDELKASLIDFLETQPQIPNFDYEGSAINTIIDLLVRNAVYGSFQANMVANESFIDSAQIRGNVASHAQKLSYTPRSSTAARATIQLNVKPNQTPPQNLSISAQPGLTFLTTQADETYTFSTRNKITLPYSNSDQEFVSNEIEIYQGQYISTTTRYKHKPIMIPNQTIDTSTLRVTVHDSGASNTFTLATSLTQLGADKAVYFLKENTRGFYELKFGQGVLGIEPSMNSKIEYEYIATDSTHANGVDSFLLGGTIGPYSDVTINTVQEAYGGHHRDSIEDIRFLAPKTYQAQNRAVSPTDYEVLIKQEFPFIRNVKVWGGEDSNPPKYGVAMVSVIPNEGLRLTTTLKDRITQLIRTKNIASVTPEIIEPDIFSLHLNFGYRLKTSSTLTSSTTIEDYLVETALQYSDQSLLDFGLYYNEYELTSELDKNNKLETVSIQKTVSTTFEPNTQEQTQYEINFNNELKPNTIKFDNFVINPDVSNEIITDDGRGRLIYQFVVSGSQQTQEVGEVDYQTGLVKITAQFSDHSDIMVQAEPVGDNFYVGFGQVVRIGEVNTYPITQIT